ncbi:MAG: HgcAB-associated protein [Methanothrix sp.]|nr:HgcAB-associated protein [Methanothrix sp.]MDD2834855.1 HgcAB-associated protein [Methanothrix sp.]MDD4446187.1 HgcAB-associated protein [Methanothrix sp.]
MTAKDECESCCQPNEISSCSVESIVSIDERGQMVLPKEIRERAKIKPGDKLALLSLEKDGKVCCLSLIKVEELECMVKSRLGPVINEAFKEEAGGKNE